MKNLKLISSIIMSFLILIPFIVSAQGRQLGQVDRSKPLIATSTQKSTEIQMVQNMQRVIQNNPAAIDLENLPERIEEVVETREEGQVLEMQNQNRINRQNNINEIVEQRRSRVANAVQTMLQVAERNGGIGEQIRVIAQNQNENQERLEAELEKSKNRSKIARFFFGPNREALNSAENKIAEHSEMIENLKEVALQVQEDGDVEILEQQIEVMEEMKSEFENEIKQERKVFSLFGWLGKIINR